ncbi:N-acetylmuramoyl-L-alanine amidase [Bacillus toyonensis]|uniref:N-acetylmuramoyl-L-alanine amidase n=1 Tax=Bacillus toyonensis TaxID=155322 RepID=UPI000BF99F54|nr:N-acetylmuramoyl-L-alanine amidase [Bacillus toyonensis]PGF05384.1 N-acetylmuramoyl-L-alanine amidase [Bacillus toyonensis]
MKNQINLLAKVLLIIPIAFLFFFSNVTNETIVSANNGDYKTWKQYEGDWADRLYVSKYGQYKFGDHVGMPNKSKGMGTMADWGCYLTAMAIQIGKSGTGPADNDPWKFAEHMHKGGYMLAGNDSLVQNEKDGVNTYTGGKFRAHEPFRQDVGGKSKEQKTAAIKAVLDAGGYPIVRVGLNGGTHFVAVDRIEGDKVVLMDPGSSKDDLFAKYGSTVNQVRFFESDTPSTNANGNGTGGGAQPPTGEGGAQPQQPTKEQQEKINIARMEWDEGKIKGLPKPRNWEEDPVPIAHLSELDTIQHQSLEKWKKEVKQEEKIDMVKYARTGLMLIGIFLLVFSLIYLVAYMFDRVSMFEFKFFEWLTLGKLTPSATGDSTFLRNKEQQYGPKLVNLRDFLIVEFLLIGLSMLLLSGSIFYVIEVIIDFFRAMTNYISNL